MFRRQKPPSLADARAARKDWRSYDEVADVYERVRAPIHTPPVRDLVAAAEPARGTRVLDVGTGTGVAAAAAAERVGREGLIVGVDASVPMLSFAAARGVRGVAATAIDLPFRDGTFDTVLAAFVLHIVSKLETALFDVLRVLRPGGRIAIATWVAAEDEFTLAWREVAESFAPKELLADARRKAAPWWEHLSDPRRIEETLRRAKVREIRVERRDYRSESTIADYLAGREASAIGRFLRDMLGPSLWERFQQRVDATFRERFRDPIGDTSEVLISTGTKPV